MSPRVDPAPSQPRQSALATPPERTTPEHLRDVIEELSLGAERALSVLKVPEADWPHHLALLSE